MAKYYKEKVASHGMRKHAMGYVKGLKKSAECKNALSRAESRKDYEEAFALIERNKLIQNQTILFTIEK